MAVVAVAVVAVAPAVRVRRGHGCRRLLRALSLGGTRSNDDVALAQMGRHGTVADVDDHYRIRLRVGVVAHRDLVLILSGAWRALSGQADATEGNQRHQRRAGHHCGNGSRSLSECHSVSLASTQVTSACLPKIEAGKRKNLHR